MSKRKPSEKKMRAAAVGLVHRIGALCEGHGAAPPTLGGLGRHEWSLATRLGRLAVTVYADCPPSDMMTVFGRFEEAARAAKHLGDSNGYTGKWNLHVFMDEGSPEDVARRFEARLRPLLDARPTAEEAR